MTASAFDPRITAFFGDAVLRAGFMPVPHLFLRHYGDLGLSTAEAMFLLQVMEITWDVSAPPRAVSDLARRMGVDARSIRRYSESVAASGLLVLYDQYDDTGAQIENGYDLSPLFQRLAALAPEPALSGAPRRREARPVKPQPRVAATRPAGPMSHHEGADSFVRGVVDITVRGRSDSAVRGRRIGESGLKRESRISEKTIMHDDASSCDKAGKAPSQRGSSAAVGWSLRQQRPLSLADVTATDAVLQRMGIDRPVRSHISTTLAPAEAWTLWAYGLAKHWRVPLMITQVYDKAQRQPRSASDLPPQYDAVGELLAALDPTLAERLLHLVAEQCPQVTRPDAVAELQAVQAQTGDAPLYAVWTMMATLRGAPTAHCPLLPPPRSSGTGAEFHAAPETSRWAAVLARLSSQVPPNEFATWLQPTTLVEVDGDRAIIGTSNIFAREHVEVAYHAAIAQAMALVFGRALRVQVVITS